MRLVFNRNERFWRWALVAGVGIFLVTRFLVLTAFPVFNDEAIYLQYSQLVHQDFGKYKFISEGGMYADWKPPLQYWIGSPFIGFIEDPLIAGRLAALFVSLLGLWGIWLFVRELLGRAEAAGAVLIYALCPPALFFNIQFVAETFVFSIAPFLYWALLRAIRPGKLRPAYGLLAALFGALLILSKQSGMVYVLLALLFPLTLFGRKESRDKEARTGSLSARGYDWPGFLARFGLVSAALLLAFLLSRLGVSAESGQVQSNFDRNWLLSLREILAWPGEIWRANLASVRDYYYHYYSVFILLPLSFFFSIASAEARRLKLRDAVVSLGFLGGSIAVIFLLRGFNEYIYNTAVIVFLIPILARSLFAAGEYAGYKKEGKGWNPRRWAGTLTLASFAFLGVHWIYQDVLMKVSPAGYLRRSSQWAINGYLENWSGGFGIAEAIAYLEKQPGPGLVLADPQWGNPRTALEVWNKRYPDLQVIGLTGDFQVERGTQAAKTYIDRYPFKSRFVVFSAATNSIRKTWQDNVEKYFCSSREEIQVETEQPPIVICKF